MLKKPKSTSNALPVAIVGMSCMFAGAGDLKGYWRMLLRGEDAITEVPDSHWSGADYYAEDPKTPDHVYCTRGGFLSPVDFDPTQFGIPPAILEATDTAQLLGLLTASFALEDAGYAAGADFDRTRTSVILGVTGTQELAIPLSSRLGHPVWRNALAEAGVDETRAREVISRIGDAYVSWQENSFPGLLGNVVAGRIANRLDLGGTNCVVDAACASSLSAVNLALLELETGRSDMVLTGGVDALNDIFMHMCFSRSQVLSRTGDARPFSADADGTVLGEGIGIVALKRLEDAVADGDRIYAVIRGLGTSSDGKSQSIYAPRAEGQIAALSRAYQNAGVDPATVGLIEAHGTGTRIGDAVEFSALTRFFGDAGAAPQECALGSVKSMIGHTKAAAGVAGLIKAALSLHFKVLPPTLKAAPPDPDLDIEKSPFYLNTQSRPWVSSSDHPRRGGVSAFGFGGSNFHLVVEEKGPERSEVAWDGAVEIAAWSAETHQVLAAAVKAFLSEIQADPDFSRLARLAAGTRRAFSPQAPFRLAVILEKDADFVSALNKARRNLSEHPADAPWQDDPAFYGTGPAPGTLAFVFPGQGSQYPGMGRDLACRFPEMLRALETVDAAVQDSDDRLSDRIYPRGPREQKALDAALRRTDRAQPAIGAVSAGMLDVLSRFAVDAQAAAGHSYGELTALLAAGRLTREDFFFLSVQRGRLMAAAGEGTDAGAMLAVRAPLAEIEEKIVSQIADLRLANRNAPNQGVLSGPCEAVDKALALCRENRLKAVRLPVAAAFHSPLVESARLPFVRCLEKTPLSPGRFPVWADTTAAPYPDDPRQAHKILAGQMTRAVDFVGIVENLYAAGVRTFVEVGPKAVLTGLVRTTLADRPATAAAVDASGGRRSGTGDLARLLAVLAAEGRPVNLGAWEHLPAEGRKPVMRIPLSGANYRAPRRVDPPKNALTDPKRTITAPRLPADAQKPVDDIVPAARPSKRTVEPPTVRPASSAASSKTMTRNREPDAPMISGALQAVQDGLKSMQDLQIRTARAHEKFLETQAQAGQALQRMIQSIEGLIAGAPLPAVDIRIPAASPSASAVREPAFPVPPSSAPAVETPAPPAPPAPPAAPPAASESPVLATLLATVSRLTGYPEEMLTAEMDLESDLGIDSIKRVEILSALEEALPDLPAVSPEAMSELKTLGQIAGHLGGRVPVNSPQDTSGPAAGEIAPGPNRSAGRSGTVETTLIRVVSELTGYPEEMLTAEMDLESDLGIDSIKRVEILSALEEALPDLPAVSPEAMGELKTLGQIAALVEKSGAPPAAAPQAAPAPRGPEKEPAIPSETAVVRRTVSVTDAPRPEGPEAALAPGSTVLVFGSPSPMADAAAEALAARDLDVVRVRPGFSEKELPAAAGLLVLAEGSEDNAALPREAFRLARSAAESLGKSGRAGFAFFTTVTRIDGAFGFSGQTCATPYAGALAGLAKTAALEWPEVRCLALDVSPRWNDASKIAESILSEIFLPAGVDPVEIGLSENGRRILALAESEAETVPTALPGKGDVVVVSGGARGVTAASALALAEAGGARLVLLGRSPLPRPEPEWLSGLTDPAEIKRALMENAMAGDKPEPKTLEAAFRRVLGAREIRQTLDRLDSMGGGHYFSVDVRDPKAVRHCLAQVRSKLGPIRGLIHGAGVLHDRHITDKTDAQFADVFDTKVRGLENLLAATAEDPLSHLVVFSSVAARFGNAGQADYAMANEALNKTAWREAARRPQCRVRAINWGPWDGGMVSESLKREFARRGVDLIPVAAGAAALVREMASDGPVEVVIGGGLGLAPVTTVPKPPVLTPAVAHRVDLKSYPVLDHHRLQGRPVVPLALITEWMAHGALHHNPGLRLAGLDDLRLLSGIKMDASELNLQFMAGQTARNNGHFCVPVEIHGENGGRPRVHAQATALLVDTPAVPPENLTVAEVGLRPYSRSVEDAYANVLFHGPTLHGIQEILGCCEKGIRARILTAPSPSQWIANPLRSRWIADPLVLDSAFQLAILWSDEIRGVRCLPSYVGAFRQYGRAFPAEGVQVALQVNQVSDRKLVGDFFVMDASGKVTATLTGFEAIMDPALAEAFNPSRAA